MSSIRGSVIAGEALLRATSSSARLDAELLLCSVLKCERLALIVRSAEAVPLEAEMRFNQLIARRALREPVAYLIGEQEFFGLMFEVTPSVLIPRPETELLVEQTLREILPNERAPRILDLGTGSGCVAVALATELARHGKHGSIKAVDKSLEALAVAKRNAARHRVSERIEFQASDWFSALQGERFDWIVGNPPYVEQESAEVSPEVHYEPSAALYSGADGLQDIIRILSDAPRYLSPGGIVLLECGYRQGALVFDERFMRDFPERSVLKDLAGMDRILRFASSAPPRSPW